jgi:hypothetical protein
MTGHRLRFVGATLVAASVLPGLAADPPSRRDADLLKQKMAGIALSGAARSPEPRRTSVTENELNAYLVHEMAPRFPAAVSEPSISMLGEGRVAGRVILDLDRVRGEVGAAGPLNFAGLLGGRLPVEARGLLHAFGGVARFELESAAVGGVPVPARLLEQIVSYYTRSPRYPAGISLDDSFELPARIREIQVERGRAIVVQ